MIMFEAVTFFFVFGIALFLIMVAILQWLWNITMPELFGLKFISYWQSLRLALIAGILFGSGNLLSFNFGG